MQYRSDIDGLRAFAVFTVIFYHSGFELFSGGYVGVDIFFVISGFLITSLVVKEIDNENFSIWRFYIRRIGRLVPALAITLLFTLVFGFLFYDTKAFNSLGKDAFFSAFGLVNILYGQGVDYFASDASIRPLIHLWSLGVEEQFYFVWPTILIVLVKRKRSMLIAITLLLFLISLVLSERAIFSQPAQAYFFPHYRAYELLFGALVCFFVRGLNQYQPLIWHRNLISYIGFATMLVPVFLYEKNSAFPGVNALWPCFGAGLYIAFAQGTDIARVLSNRIVVYIGLISYPLYLFHQPIISYIKFFETDHTPYLTFTIVVFIAIPLAAITYKWIEIPIRMRLRTQRGVSLQWTIVSLMMSLAVLGGSGFFVAKENGIPSRFKLLNPYAYDVVGYHQASFYADFKRGFQISRSDASEILFVGDSTMQQYVSPIIDALRVNKIDIDIVTRGGCVLLKNVEFQDKVADISCDSLRKDLYASKKTYKFVVISQHWSVYDDAILNATADRNLEGYKLEKWREFIDPTLAHFEELAEQVILIGEHPRVDGTQKLRPNLFTTKEKYSEGLKSLRVTNRIDINKSLSFFDFWGESDNVQVIHPFEMFCESECVLHGKRASYFSDPIHITRVSTDFVVSRLLRQNLKLGLQD